MIFLFYIKSLPNNNFEINTQKNKINKRWNLWGISYHSICNSVELFCTTAISDKTDSVVLCEDTELRWDVSMCIVFKIHRDVSTTTFDSSLIPFDLSRFNSLWSTMF